MVDGVWVVLSLEAEAVVLPVARAVFSRHAVQEVGGVELDAGQRRERLHHPPARLVFHSGERRETTTLILCLKRFPSLFAWKESRRVKVKDSGESI